MIRVAGGAAWAEVDPGPGIGCGVGERALSHCRICGRSTHMHSNANNWVSTVEATV